MDRIEDGNKTTHKHILISALENATRDTKMGGVTEY